MNVKGSPAPEYCYCPFLTNAGFLPQNKIHSHWIVCEFGGTTDCLSPPTDGIRGEVPGVVCPVIRELHRKPADSSLDDG